MFRPRSIRTTARLISQLPRTAQSRRAALSTAPPHLRSRSWKNATARWTFAGGLLWFYNTSAVFADGQDEVTQGLPQTEAESEITPTPTPTIDELAAKRAAAREAQANSRKTAVGGGQSDESDDTDASTSPDSAGELEEEAGQQGAFNEETGEINWDCPCLGGMAHGPCGDKFKAAFSCFVFSKEEPKGVECIEHFKAMQECFREHPDVYGAELDEEGSGSGSSSSSGSGSVGDGEGRVDGGEGAATATAAAVADGGAGIARASGDASAASVRVSEGTASDGLSTS